MIAGVVPAGIGPRRRRTAGPAVTLALALVSMAMAQAALAQDAAAWLNRAASAARSLNYSGTIMYQHGGRVETSRLVHINEGGSELEKLVSLDGPAREIIRGQAEVRFYYPEAKLVRIEPRTFRNAFPAVSPEQQRSLLDYYEFKKGESARVAGMDAQAYVFEPRDGLRYGHKFWADAATGLLLKARVLNEVNDVVEQLAFADLSVGGRMDRSMVQPSWPPVPPDWQVREIGPGDIEIKDTGWSVAGIPAGFSKMVEGFRTVRGKRYPVAHLVFSDGLVAVSVFVEPLGAAPHPIGLTQRGGTNIYMRQLGDHLITVLGEAPALTVRQMGNSVTRR